MQVRNYFFLFKILNLSMKESIFKTTIQLLKTCRSSKKRVFSSDLLFGLCILVVSKNNYLTYLPPWIIRV